MVESLVINEAVKHGKDLNKEDKVAKLKGDEEKEFKNWYKATELLSHIFNEVLEGEARERGIPLKKAGLLYLGVDPNGLDARFTIAVDTKAGAEFERRMSNRKNSK